jgi:predicted HTH domain antitoxin
MPRRQIEVPRQALDHLHMEPSEFALAMKTMAALKMYELGQLSFREAAALAGVSRGEFLQLLRTYQIPPFE